MEDEERERDEACRAEAERQRQQKIKEEVDAEYEDGHFGAAPAVPRGLDRGNRRRSKGGEMHTPAAAYEPSVGSVGQPRPRPARLAAVTANANGKGAKGAAAAPFGNDYSFDSEFEG
jgi:hypothetical protein